MTDPKPYRTGPPEAVVPPLPGEALAAQVRRAAEAQRPVRRAARTAYASAATTLTIAAAGVGVVMLSWSIVNLLTVLAVGGIGVAEWIGAGKMKHAEVGAARWLGKNQLVFLAMIVLYCLWQMAAFDRAEIRKWLVSPDTQQLLSAMPELQQTLEGWMALAPLLYYGFYSLVILTSLAFQGGLAWYYFSRQKVVERYLAATSEEVRAIMAAAGR